MLSEAPPDSQPGIPEPRNAAIVARAAGAEEEAVTGLRGDRRLDDRGDADSARHHRR
jgi:hypothetical protein